MQRATERSEISAITAALEQCGGNRESTAKLLGISRRTLQYKLKKYGLLTPRVLGSSFRQSWKNGLCTFSPYRTHFSTGSAQTFACSCFLVYSSASV